MKLWPWVMDLTIDPPERERPIHLWLPLFLLWPLLAIIALLGFAITIPVDVVLLLIARPYHHFTLLLYRCLELLAETRGFSVRVNSDRNVIAMTLY